MNYSSDVKKKVIVAGGRDFQDIQLMLDKLDKILSKTRLEIEIVSGGAKGANSYGEIYASVRGHSVKVMPADWNKHGKRAGYLRNEDMAEYADACIVFWDGKSPGSRHMIEIAKKAKLPLRIIRY